MEPMYISSNGDLIISILIALAAICINWKFLKDMNADEKDRGPNSNGSILKDVLTTYTKAGMIFLPIGLIWYWILNEDFELPVMIQYLFCSYGNMISKFFGVYFDFTSLVIASMRYTFVVHNNSVLQFGIEQTKTLFYYGSIVIPLVLTILSEGTIEVPLYFKPHSICVDYYAKAYNDSSELSLNITHSISSPIYCFVHEHISTDITYYVGWLVIILWAIIVVNVVEGILYWKTFHYIRR